MGSQCDYYDHCACTWWRGAACASSGAQSWSPQIVPKVGRRRLVQSYQGLEGHEGDMQAPGAEPQGHCLGCSIGHSAVDQSSQRTSKGSQEGEAHLPRWQFVLGRCVRCRSMRCRSNAKSFKGTVLEVLGTARGLGCTIDGEDAEDATQMVQDDEQELPEA